MLRAPDFESIHIEREKQVLTRPSLSYWSDAWIRLKKNKQALVAMFIILMLISFILVGPLFWTNSPNEQDLNQISRPPSFGRGALIVSEFRSWEGVHVDVPSGSRPAMELSAPTGLEAVGTPSTQVVRLKWNPVEGSRGYTIYRSERRPDSVRELGLALGETRSAGHVSFEDQLRLKPVTYYYSVVASDGLEESDNYALIRVDVSESILLSDAHESMPGAKVGDTFRLAAHPLGTDYLGRDMLARLMEGGRVSLFIGVTAPLLYIFIGFIFGGLAGYVGGRIDNVMMRFADFILGLPFLLFVILIRIASGIGPGESGVTPLLIALIVLSWPGAARLVRGQVLSLREEGFIQAARLLGARPLYLVVRHMFPNVVGLLMVSLTIAIPGAIFTEAFLSFIGMGVAPPTASWGSMANEGYKTFNEHPHELLAPAIVISLTTLAFNLFGDGLRDALDARLRSRG